MRIAITGGKGGTGKSVVATALAAYFSRNKKVLLMDLDADCPNDHLILSIERKKEKNVYVMIPDFDFSKCIKCGRCSQVCMNNAIVSVKGKTPILIPEQCNGCGACAIACPVKCIGESQKIIGTIYSGKKNNIELISSDLKPGESFSEFVVNAAKKFAEPKEKDYDVILVDTSAGTHCDVISAVSGCDLALAVTEPTPLGAHDLRLILELLKILKVPVKIVLNKSTVGDKELIFKIAEEYDTEIITEIPYEKSIVKTYSKGEPVKHKSIEKITEFLGRK